MMIITQKIENEANIIIQKEMQKTFRDCGVDLCEGMKSLYAGLVLTTHIKKIILKSYESAIKKVDEMYYNSDYRKENFYVSGKRKRKIYFPFGELTFERYYYVDHNKKNGFYLIDELFNFEKYRTYDKTLRAILIDNYTNTNANNTAERAHMLLNNFDEYTNQKVTLLPRQTIYNWIKKFNIPKIEYELCDTHGKDLYVMVDEKWLHEQIRLCTLPEEEKGKRHYIMTKAFVSFTGYKEKGKRRELLNKHVFLTTSNKAWEEFVEEIHKIYNYENFENIYLLSDAGTWILSGADELKLYKANKVIKNTCTFHAIKYVHKLTHSSEKRKLLKDYIFIDKDKKKFIKLADEIIENCKNKKKRTTYKNYIVNHWKTIQNMAEREIGSSMESHISHYVAAPFGSRPKGYSRKRVEKYLKLQEYKLNGVNIMQLYLCSYNKEEDYTYNEEEVSYSIFEHDTSVLPTKCSSDPISIFMNNVAFPC